MFGAVLEREVRTDLTSGLDDLDVFRLHPPGEQIVGLGLHGQFLSEMNVVLRLGRQEQGSLSLLRDSLDNGRGLGIISPRRQLPLGGHRIEGLELRIADMIAGPTPVLRCPVRICQFQCSLPNGFGNRLVVTNRFQQRVLRDRIDAPKP